MATIALAAAGAAVGSALLPAGITVLGATLTGAAIGSQIGALAGSYVDNALFAPSGQSRTFHGPRISNLYVTSSTEGAPVPRVYGRFRLGGQVIWAADLAEEVTTTTERPRGGKGRPRGGGGGCVTQVEYRYYADFAVALCEGPISGIGRVWADGQELELAGITYRLHTGNEDQPADSLMVAREGADAAPAYRGIAYVVFEHLPLAAYGNRLPQLSFEVHRAVDRLNDDVRGVVIIPGSGEFVYATTPVTRLGDGGARVYENVHTRQAATDWEAALDQLEATLPNARSASLIVSWFGTDLRASQCQIRPGVELDVKDNAPISWRVAGEERNSAHVVSRHDGRPAYGGTPSDQTVVGAIRDLVTRGFSITLTPFILMDIASGNALPDPHGGSGQPAYPWRGRITLDIAPGHAGTTDKTAAAAASIAAFVGTAAPGDFSLDGDNVIYAGPDEWSWRRQVLHYAWLAKAAGNVDAFVIGSELCGLTRIRSAAASYPFVQALIQLATDVKSVLGPATRITYAADWSEYFGHQPQDGSGDVYFHLDPLWSSPSIDAIGVDLYWPLADWRDGRGHADAIAGARSTYDVDYLASNVRGGEGFDWYYASPADRASQTRTPITDGQGKPWVFRTKDLAGWWTSQHFNRPAGIESAAPTSWVPRSKPVWLMECGCPAVDKGANQPNVFVDPKSAESALPYFSDGRRDDLMQRRYLQALIGAFDTQAVNPLSYVYAGRMVDTSRIHVYAWDARPYPAFPDDTATWGDGANWRLGHWLNGRLAAAPLSDLIAAVLDDFGFSDHDATSLEGVVAGYALDRIMSAREALQPLELAFFFDAVESGGHIAFRHRGSAAIAASVGEDDLVLGDRQAGPITYARGQESELPAAAKIAYLGASDEYRQAIAESRRLVGASGRIAQADLAIAIDSDQAARMADTWLFEAWSARERASFTLPPSRIAVEPGDMIAVGAPQQQRLFRVTGISERGEREVEAMAIDPSIYIPAKAASRTARTFGYPLAGMPIVDFMDLPLLRGDEPPQAGYAAASLSPWPGGVAIYNSPETTGYRLSAIASAPATAGLLTAPLFPGPAGRFDRASHLRVKLDRGELASASRLALLSGSNLAAVRSSSGEWEVLQFEAALLVAPLTYELTGLLRAQAGTEAAMLSAHAAGTRFVLLDGAITGIEMAASEIGLPLTWRYGPADRDLGEESYATATHTFRGLGMRPLSPVHVSASRSGGDVMFHWFRRTRLGGDSWETTEVPLGEESERYEVDILDGSSVVRTLSVTTTQANYAIADQIADFGAAQTSLSVRVFQLNSVWGRGAPASAAV